jgi:hypothetical protein
VILSLPLIVPLINDDDDARTTYDLVLPRYQLHRFFLLASVAPVGVSRGGLKFDECFWMKSG